MRGTSQEPKAKKTSKRSRSRSPKKVRKHSRSRSFERPRNKKGHKERERRERERELEKEREPLFEEIETGKIYDGAVTKIFNYGVFVRLSNFRTRKEGLVHISNISHKKITNPEDVLKSGDRVKVKACSVQDN
jgi:ribosomal protein S1